MVPEINGNYFNFPEFAVFYALTKICSYSDLCNFVETFVIWYQKKTARNGFSHPGQWRFVCWVFRANGDFVNRDPSIYNNFCSSKSEYEIKKIYIFLNI